MSKKNRKAWRASEQRKLSQPQPPQQAAPQHLRGLDRLAFIDKLVHELFVRQGGESMDLHIRTGQLTLDAFESQMLAARDGSKGWGPDVSVYEARMTRALNERLMREKRSWLREIRKRIEEALDVEDAMLAEEAAQAEEADESRTEPEPQESPEARVESLTGAGALVAAHSESS